MLYKVNSILSIWIKSDPVLQTGEGNFRLADIKQMEITDDFTSLDENVRKCQTEIRKEDCVTKKYLENMKRTCNCLPFQLQNYSSHDKVWISLIFIKFFSIPLKQCWDRLDYAKDKKTKSVGERK